MNLNNEAKARALLARSPWSSQQDALQAWDEAVALLTADPGDGLPPIGSTVRIVSGGLRVWPDAEKFLGADCTLCAIFMTGDTQMVAVEHQADLVCCCFIADMVRTPEQLAAEVRLADIAELAQEMAGFIGREDPSEQHQKFAGYLIDHGWHKRPAP